MTPHPSGEGLPPWELFPKVPEGLEDLKFAPILRSAVKKGLFQPLQWGQEGSEHQLMLPSPLPSPTAPSAPPCHPWVPERTCHLPLR